MQKNKIFIFTIIIITGVCYFSVGQESTLDTFTEDELFGDDMIEIVDEDESEEDLFADDVVTEYDEQNLDSDLDNLLLENQALEWGGRFNFTVTPSWQWQDKDLTGQYIMDNYDDPDQMSLETELKATLFFDARPDKDFRVFGKTDITYPFTEDEDWQMDDIISIKELFADFNWQNLVFFRGGKHTIKWGVGYFYSPADVLNITPIDPEDPEAEREGPVSLKTQIPIDIHNIYLYTITHDITTPEEIYLAPKLEFVIGNLETGIGGVYQKDIAPMGMLTFSLPLSFGLDLFAEGVLSYGANKTFIEETDVSLENPFGFIAVEKDDEYFYSATAGFIFPLNEIDMEWEAITLTAQYLYNGTGYEDPAIFENQTGIGFLLMTEEITFQDLMQPGIHYAAAQISWHSMFDSDFGTSVFWMSNLTDGSGRVTPALSWDILEYAQIKLSTPLVYGGEYDELSVEGQSFSINLGITAGAGSF